MYLDHRVTAKIARILDMIDLSALLLSLREQPLFFADGNSDYVKNRSAFEVEFRRVLDLLK